MRRRPVLLIHFHLLSCSMIPLKVNEIVKVVYTIRERFEMIFIYGEFGKCACRRQFFNERHPNFNVTHRWFGDKIIWNWSGVLEWRHSHSFQEGHTQHSQNYVWALPLMWSINIPLPSLSASRWVCAHMNNLWIHKLQMQIGNLPSCQVK